MNEPAIRDVSTDRRWPMTEEALLTLAGEVSQLRIDLATLAGDAAPDDGVVHLPAFLAARRFDLLSAVLETATTVDQPDRAVIGRRVTLREPEGDSVTYALVFPGDGDPAQGWISADSPLGAAVMGRVPGDRVEVMAPAGPRVITVLAVT